MSLISNNTPNLHFVIFSEVNTASFTNKRLLWKERGCYKFMLSLESATFHCKNFLQLILQSYIWSFVF